MKLVLAVFTCLMIGSFVVSWDTSPDKLRAENAHPHSSEDLPSSWGAVNWVRGLDNGRRAAQESGKPLMVLRPKALDTQQGATFGAEVLSHPLIVEAAEDLFVPVVVEDELDDGSVIGFLNSDASPLVPHHSGVPTLTVLASKMRAALQTAQHKVPGYLTFVGALEEKTVTAEFAMHCYWEGESKLGGIDGVVATRSGWREGLEVVQVQYLPKVVDYQALLTTAQSFDCASKVFAHTDPQLKIAKAAVGNKASLAKGAMRDAKASDQKYYLLQTAYRYLPMTPRQTTKINALIKTRRSPQPLLSPRQLALMGQISQVQQAQAGALKGLAIPDREEELGEYAQRLKAKLALASKRR